MRDLWSVAQIRAAEEEAIAVTGADALMQRAAYGLARHCLDRLGRGYGTRVVLLVGAGNNGGDALYAGVTLLRRGVRVHAALLNPDRVHVRGVLDFVQAGGTVGAAEDARPALERADLVLDGITGIGGHGALRSPAAELLAGLDTPVVAVDVPSGVDADTGHAAGPAVHATSTVTFGGYKLGLAVGAGPAAAGEIQLVDIGLTGRLRDPVARVLEAADVAALLPVPRAGDDKYTRGVVGVVSGSAAYEGAAVLSVGGALRAKAGMVRYVGSAAAGVRARWPEAVVGEGRPTEAGRVQAWVIGPGLGTDDAAADLVTEVLATDVPVLVDADGLTVLSTRPELLWARTAPTVLTPHDREFERMFGPVGDDRVGAARRAADSSGAVVLLKGQATIVAGPDDRVRVTPPGSRWLATAGTGDVLSGLAGALLAAGLDSLDAAAAAAYLHGRAADIAAGGGPGHPILAMDVVDALPHAIADLLAGPTQLVSAVAPPVARNH